MKAEGTFEGFFLPSPKFLIKYCFGPSGKKDNSKGRGGEWDGDGGKFTFVQWPKDIIFIFNKFPTLAYFSLLRRASTLGRGFFYPLGKKKLPCCFVQF